MPFNTKLPSRELFVQKQARRAFMCIALRVTQGSGRRKRATLKGLNMAEARVTTFTPFRVVVPSFYVPPVAPEAIHIEALRAFICTS